MKSVEKGVADMMEKAKTFEDLWIWQESRDLVRSVYGDFGDGSSGHRDYGFRDQIQRAGISIMNNIAEGFERSSDAEFARFLDIAKSSCGEVRSMYYPAQDVGYIADELGEQRRMQCRRLSAGIASLMSHLKKA